MDIPSYDIQFTETCEPGSSTKINIKIAHEVKISAVSIHLTWHCPWENKHPLLNIIAIGSFMRDTSLCYFIHRKYYNVGKPWVLL